MAKILAPFEYNIDIKNLWDIKTTSGSTKILAYKEPNEFPKATLASQNLGAFNLKFEMRRTYQFSKRLRALPKFWCTLKQMDMERTECVPKDDFGPA